MHEHCYLQSVGPASTRECLSTEMQLKLRACIFAQHAGCPSQVACCPLWRRMKIWGYGSEHQHALGRTVTLWGLGCCIGHSVALAAWEVGCGGLQLADPARPELLDIKQPSGKAKHGSKKCS